ncbi:hypothetical protein BH18ACT12_BH18ACT12_15110 [soil metagenome]
MVGRAAALLALGVALSLYFALHERLWGASTWWDITFMALVLIPACFALVWLVLPLRHWRGLLPAAIALGCSAAALHFAGWSTPENFCKLFALTAIGFWFLGWFESLSWGVLIAAIIPLVDAYSVFSPRGPTNVIVTEHRDIFTALSFAFPIPGEPYSANLGLPDLLFFALFLAASVRFALRPGLTWSLLTLSFGVTLALAAAWRGGLPALPLLSIAFLLANADLIWQRLGPAARRERRSVETGTRSSGQGDA